MNSSPVFPAPVRWSPRRWLYTVAAVLAGQVGLLLFLADPLAPRPPVTGIRASIDLAVDPWSERQLAELPTLNDPTLFALPSERGFSGSAWLAFAPLEHRLTDWTEPLRWLAPQTSGLAQTFARLAATNTTAPLRVADKPLPPLTGSEIYVANAPAPARSELRVTGELARRPLLKTPPLPSWPHADVLPPTVAQAVVDAEGFTLAAALLSSCGLKEADDFAMKFTAQARFQALVRGNGLPTRAAPPAWGQLVFQWHTVAPTATNTAPPAP